MKKIIIIGSGGHAKVVADIILTREKDLNEDLKIIGFLDDNFKNLKYLKKSFLFLLGLTIFQLSINLIFNYLNIDNVSGLFDLSIKNYFVNISFLILNYLLIIVFKKGENSEG